MAEIPEHNQERDLLDHVNYKRDTPLGEVYELQKLDKESLSLVFEHQDEGKRAKSSNLKRRAVSPGAANGNNLRDL
jgi:hypothetical protein